MFLEVKHISKQIGADEVLKGYYNFYGKGENIRFPREKWMWKINVNAGDLRVGHSNTWQRYNRWRTAWKRTIVSTKPGNDD